MVSVVVRKGNSGCKLRPLDEAHAPPNEPRILVEGATIVGVRLGQVMWASTSTKNPEGLTFRVELAGLDTPSGLGRIEAGMPELPPTPRQ